MTAASERELRKELRAFGKELTPEQWAPFDEYAAERGLTNEKRGEHLRDSYLIDLQCDGRDSGRAWLERQRAWDRKQEEWKAKVDAERAARHAEQAARREARDRKRAEAYAFALRGEPIPLHLRKHPRECLQCGKRLTDDESVRIGLGPDCLKTIARVLDVDHNHLRKDFIAEEAAPGMFRMVRTCDEAQP